MQSRVTKLFFRTDPYQKGIPEQGEGDFCIAGDADIPGQGCNILSTLSSNSLVFLFGLSSASRTFTKVMKPTVTYLRSLGIRMLVYLDDMIILVRNKEELLKWQSIVLHLLENLDFLINCSKSELELTQILVFLGFLINTVTMEIKLPKEKVMQATRGSEPPAGSAVISKTAGTPDRNLPFNSSSNSSCPPPLQRPSSSEASSREEGRIRCDSPSLSRSKRRSVMVDSESESSEWITTGERSAISTDGDGCFTDGLGGSMLRGVDRWPLDGRREITPHKLSGIIGCHICNSGFCQGQMKLGNSYVDRQLHSSSIYQYHVGGTRSTRFCTLTKNLWNWCLQRHLFIAASRIPPHTYTHTHTHTNTIHKHMHPCKLHHAHMHTITWHCLVIIIIINVRMQGQRRDCG